MDQRHTTFFGFFGLMGPAFDGTPSSKEPVDDGHDSTALPDMVY
jgi:hypothetical protein